MYRRFSLLTIALSVTLCVAACADDHDHDHAHEEGETHSAVEEACEHVVSGPFVDVEAADTADAAPSATHEHSAVNVTLPADPDDSAMQMGYVTFEADEAADFAFFLSADVAFAILDASGNEVEIEETEAVSECDEVAVEHVAELEIGTYTLLLGPTTETLVSLVVEEANHEGDDH